jgi:hypothetical protein
MICVFWVLALHKYCNHAPSFVYSCCNNTRSYVAGYTNTAIMHGVLLPVYTLSFIKLSVNTNKVNSSTEKTGFVEKYSLVFTSHHKQGT